MNTLLQLLVPASLLFAAPSADAPARERGKKANKMQRYDADGSGTLSAAEVKGTKFEKRFAKKDRNGDGELSRDEMRRGKKSRDGTKAKDHRERMKKRFAKMDADGSGEVSFDEMVAAKKDRKRSKDARKDDKRGGKKAIKGKKKSRKDAKRADRRGGKKAFANGKDKRKDRKRFAKRSRSNAT